MPPNNHLSVIKVNLLSLSINFFKRFIPHPAKPSEEAQGLGA
jgi:hypothetical protein